MLFLMIAFIPFGARPASQSDTGRNVLHIYFNSNSSILKKEGLYKINLFCKVLKSSRKKSQVLIYANCDSIDNEHSSNQLCVLRAHAIAKQLVKEGFDSTFIEEIFAKDSDKEETKKNGDRVDLEAVPSKKDKKMKLAVSDLNINREVGTDIILQDLDFEGGRHELLPEFLPVLDTLVTILKKNPTMQIEIIGHVCCTAFDEDGLDLETNIKNLSYTRAKAIYTYLVTHHIKKRRLSYTGIGGRNRLVLPEISEQDKSLNRRVELIVVRE